MIVDGHHYQNAYVTRDIEKATAELTARADVRLISQIEAENEVHGPDGVRTQVNKYAFIWVGDLQYELIEPVVLAAPMFEVMLPDRDLVRFHHVCTRVADWDEMRRQVDAGPHPLVFEGTGGAGLKFLFLDARATLGHFLEYTWMTDEMWAMSGGR